MKEITIWDNNPREMWVWDSNKAEKKKRFVIYIIPTSIITDFPVIALAEDIRGKVSYWQHCEDIEE